MSDLTDPQKMPIGTGREIAPLVIADINERVALGKQKYGESLRANNGRKALVDLYQELLDAVMYIRQQFEEDATRKPMTAREFLARQENVRNRVLIEQRLIDDGHTTREALDEQSVECLKKLQQFIQREACISEVLQGTGSLKESALQEAQRLVHGDRGDSYGHPFDDFGRTAGMVSALLSHKLREPLTQEEVAAMMICVKLSREQNKPKRDNVVDIAGYAETLQMVKDERARRESPQQPGV